jgi:membrane protease YdiL (CAAX protease family)
VLVWFLAVHLTVSLLVPRILDQAGYVADPIGLLAGISVAVFVATMFVIRRGGAPRAGESLASQVGLDTSFRPAGLPGALRGGLAAWAMALAAAAGATLVSIGTFDQGPPRGQGADVVAMVVLTGSGTWRTIGMLALLGVLVPLIEETIFRGFLYRRLRLRLSPVAAALASGLAFGAAHLSFDAFLPLSAVGFALAMAYERSRDLAVPVVGHALWNLTQAALILALLQ